MPITKAKKSQILSELEEKLSRAKSIYFAENKGLSVKDVTTLRKQLHEKGIDFMVAKKTLMKIAAKNKNLPEIDDKTIPGPIAAVIGYGEDMILPSKIVKDFGDKVEKKVVLTGGIMDGKLLSQAEAIELASLPSREILLARLVGSMKSSITGFYMVIKALSEKGGKSDSTEAAKTESPASSEPAAPAEPAAA